MSQGQRPGWGSGVTEPGQGLTSADLGAAGAALAGRPRAGAAGSGGTQLLPSTTGDAAVLPGPQEPLARPEQAGTSWH